ncbi:Sulfate adenylyltransferase [Frankliniella fusca]|uniref:Sulfate adenylyltransferase n=1 Tax=Frankliniella fusca TaxID=407009 RepID=A0AAE1HX37_9NEOP|nr:Sulfate adenylyltransferase [Frankliniella fusca]
MRKLGLLTNSIHRSRSRARINVGSAGPRGRGASAPSPICVESMNQGVCSHTDSERELTGTWCAPEVHLAVEKGYQIIKVHEVYQYPSVRVYNK